MVGKSPLRALIGRAIPSLLIVLGFSAAILAGSEAAFLVFRKPVTTFVYGLPFVAIPGSILAAVYRLIQGRRPASTKRLSLWLLSAAAILFAGSVGFHFARAKPVRFAFLESHSISLDLKNPGSPGIEKVYTYQADFDSLVRTATSELRSKGYLVRFENGRLSATIPLPNDKNSLWQVEEGVSIDPHRAIGKYFCVDGDCVETAYEPGWVTVDVVQSTGLPGWIELFTP